MDIQEINDLVCKEVLKWEWRESLDSWVDNIGHGAYVVADYRFSPSNNIQDAFFIVEKLKKQYEIGSCHKGHYCHFIEWIKTGENSSKQVYHSSEFHTLPMSICLSALKSVGIEIKI